MSGSPNTNFLVRRSSLALDNLRAFVILLVLSFHSVLAYLQFLPAEPFAFDDPPYLWRAFPIVDSHRFVGFDVFCAWQDVFLMSLFFFLSGLFVWPSLQRKGVRNFLHGRVLRLGLPFAFVVICLMPPTLYPTYLQSADDPSLAAYIRHWLKLPFWPCGPMWFLWLLLVADFAAAGLHHFARLGNLLLRIAPAAAARPGRYFAGFILVSALAYVPLAIVFTPSAWLDQGPFAFQLSRPLHYALYFFAGVALGSGGVESGLLAADGALSRFWPRWLLIAASSFVLWMALTGLTMAEGDATPFFLQILADLSFVLACATSCCCVLAVVLRFAARRLPRLTGLMDSAYGIYLVHYLFVVWLQFTLLEVALPGILKGAIVFALTLALSWGAIAALRRAAPVAQIIGAGRPRGAAAS